MDCCASARLRTANGPSSVSTLRSFSLYPRSSTMNRMPGSSALSSGFRAVSKAYSISSTSCLSSSDTSAFSRSSSSRFRYRLTGAPQMISAYYVQLSFSGGAIRYSRSSGDSNRDRISFFGSSFICLAS